MSAVLLQQHQEIDALGDFIEARLSTAFQPHEIRSLVHGLVGRVWLHLRTEESALRRLCLPGLVKAAAPALPTSLDTICQRWSEETIRDRPAHFRDDLGGFLACVRERMRWEEATVYCNRDPDVGDWRALL
jgi:hypothetical protein